MLNVIDISSWQEGLNLEYVYSYNKRGKRVRGVIVKTTEGVTYTNLCGVPWLKWLKQQKKCFGFYHFARGGFSAKKEADYFIQQSKEWFGYGIPILDWETDDCSVEWVNAFVKHVYNKTGVWCIIYANAWRITDKVNKNCPRWVANYPNWNRPDFLMARRNKEYMATCPGDIIMWQFCSDGCFPYYDGDIDCNLFFGTRRQWKKIAKGNGKWKSL